MEINILIVGKGDNCITMILDNFKSKGIVGSVTVLNNLKLPITNRFDHPDFNINVVEELNFDDFEFYYLGVFNAPVKQKVVESLNLNKLKVLSLLNVDVDVSDTSSIGNGCLFNSKVSIAAHTLIGDFVSVNRNVSIGHHCIISDYVTINPGSNIAGSVNIGKGTTIGIGSSIIDGVTIGENSFVGAGSVVTKDIPDNVIAYGNPCKVIRTNK